MNDVNRVEDSAAHSVASGRSTLEHSCPMHPEIRQDHLGSCPKCSLTLEPVASVPTLSKTEYASRFERWLRIGGLCEGAPKAAGLQMC
jgi:hypothetical protein